MGDSVNRYQTKIVNIVVQKQQKLRRFWAVFALTLMLGHTHREKTAQKLF
jgi:hypothetical protein